MGKVSQKFVEHGVEVVCSEIKETGYTSYVRRDGILGKQYFRSSAAAGEKK